MERIPRGRVGRECRRSIIPMLYYLYTQMSLSTSIPCYVIECCLYGYESVSRQAMFCDILTAAPTYGIIKSLGGNRATGQQRRLEMSNFHNEHVMQFYRHNLKTKGVFGK